MMRCSRLKQATAATSFPFHLVRLFIYFFSILCLVSSVGTNTSLFEKFVESQSRNKREFKINLGCAQG